MSGNEVKQHQQQLLSEIANFLLSQIDSKKPLYYSTCELCDLLAFFVHSHDKRDIKNWASLSANLLLSKLTFRDWRIEAFYETYEDRIYNTPIFYVHCRFSNDDEDDGEESYLLSLVDENEERFKAKEKAIQLLIFILDTKKTLYMTKFENCPKLLWKPIFNLPFP